MYRLMFFLALLSADYASFAQKNTVKRPKLVVGMVVDQMRWDYLYKYYSQYGNGGFKRLMNDGFNCQNTMINYLPSFTAPGHACIYTGSVPAIHGIAGNDFIERFSCCYSYCVEDKAERIICEGDTTTAAMSPRNLLTTTVTDELRLATNFASRVYAVALKDRGSILPGGHLANAAYWYDDKSGNFITSTYYKNPSPFWLKALNKRKLVDSLVDSNWKLMLPATAYTQSITDDNKYEGKFKGEKSTAFPHMVSALKGADRYAVIKKLPAGNTLTLEAAKACLAGENLGNEGNTDFLCVSLSSTDYVGHQFAPESVEIQDVYLRLDRELAAFLDHLDRTVGKNNYLFFLTADHGAAHNGVYLADKNVPAGLFDELLDKKLNAHLKERFNKEKIVSTFMNYGVYLNDTMILHNHLDRDKIKEEIVKYLGNMKEVSYVVDMEHPERSPLPEPIRTMVLNGYNRDRSGVIQIINNPGWYDGYGPTGTSHGTWNPYDTHIPLLWYGWHIPKGETHSVVNMTDIAATIAALLHIQMPNGCIGKPIPDVIK